MPFPQSAAPVFQELHGKYYTQTKAGQLFHGVLITPAAIPIQSATAVSLCLWNPLGSNTNAVLVRYAAGWTGTTEAPGAIQLAYFTGAGSVTATAALITAFTAATPVNGLIGSGLTSAMKFGSAATVTATTLFIPLGFSNLTNTGTATFGAWTTIYDFDGQLIVPPGTFVFPAASAATLSTYSAELSWYEAPV